MFELTWTVADAQSGTQIDTPQVTLARQGAADSNCSRPIVTTADDLGRIRVQGLCEGQFTGSLEAEGFESVEFEVALPGLYADQMEDGVLEWSGWKMDPYKSFTFQLVGLRDQAEASAFRLLAVQSSSDVRRPFDPQGRLSVEFADPYPPIEIQLDYPNSNRAVLYLPDLPRGNDTVIELDVAGEHRLEVDVRVDEQIRASLFEDEVYLQATMAPATGGSRQLNTRIYSEGAAVLTGPFSGEVMLSLTAVDANGRMYPRAARQVTVDDSVTRATLNVFEDRCWIRVVDGEDDAVVDAHVIVCTVPNSTAWITGGPADDDGRIPVAIPANREVVLTCYRGESTVAIDCPLPAPSEDGLRVLRLESMTESLFSVLVDGVETTGRAVHIEGARTLSEQVTELWIEHGQSPPVIKLLGGSEAVARVPLRDGEWTDSPRTPVLPGLNQLRVRSTGFIRARSRAALTGVIELQSGTSVMDWVHSGRTGVSDDGSGVVVVEVPVGAYEFVALDGSRSRVVVDKGMTASAY